MTARFAELRRRLATAGGVVASGASEAVQGRRDTADYRLATVIESPLRHIAVGAPVPWLDDVAFLDGTQHAELIGYVGTLAVTAATVHAAVRLRRARVFRRAAVAHRQLVIGRAAALAAFGPLPDGCTAVEIDAAEPPHPLRDADLARGLVDRARGAVELEAARAFRQAWPGTWLVVDGSLAASPDWSSDARMLGAVKSHAMLPFIDGDLDTYLTLPAGHRTSVFQPASRQVTPLYSWALRLHPFAGRDLFHGLLRIEAAATPGTLAMVDALSRHLLAERAPRANDPRADRLLYGIHDVERYLGALSA